MLEGCEEPDLEQEQTLAGKLGKIVAEVRKQQEEHKRNEAQLRKKAKQPQKRTIGDSASENFLDEKNE